MLHLVVPGLLGPVPDAVAAGASSNIEAPALRYLLARCRSTRGGSEAASLLKGLAMENAAEGPVAAHGAGLGYDTAVWYRAAPCHLRTARDRIVVFAGASVCPSTAEGDELAAAFNAHFLGDGFELVGDPIGNWHLRGETKIGGEPAPLAEVGGRGLDSGLPPGEAGRAWRRFHNEIQMLFYEHPVNVRREAAGELTINGMWLWGGGSRLPAAPLLVGVASQEAFLRGLGTLAGLESKPEPAGADRLPAATGTYLASYRAAEAARLGGDVEGWLHAVQAFESAWAQPLVEGRARFDRVVLHLAPGYALIYDGLARWRVWRRNRALSDYLIRQ